MVTRPHKPNDGKYVFTEGIDYFQAGKDSIWGNGDADMLKLLERTSINGKWLNLCAGDGRYSSDLLKKVDSLTVSDIDKGALSKLQFNLPKRYQSKLRTRSFDVTRQFPFKDQSFDGVFCTGTLHLFPRKILRQIFIEINRILKPSGEVLLDFATDIKRTSSSGELVTFGREPAYTTVEAKAFLKELFQGYKVKMQMSTVLNDFQRANPPYTLNCKFVILTAQKV
jgi:ubiquinone/menaquinone biosynthesis C-methylase UbiE